MRRVTEGVWHTGRAKRLLRAAALRILGGINAALVVMLGAFGAHGLKARMTAEMLYSVEVQ